MSLLALQLRYEQKSYWRNPASAFFTFLFPVVLFVILQATAGGQTDSDLGGVKLAQYYTPSILGYAVMSACFLAVALTVVRRREGGVLKRLRGTPLPAWALVGGLIGSSMILALLLSVVVIGVSVLGFGVHLYAGRLLPLVVTIALSALVFCALGISVSSFIPNLDSGPAIINLPYFVLVFISGTYFPVTGTLAKIAGDLPLRPFIVSAYRCFDPHLHGSAWDPAKLRTLVIWGVVATWVAARRFRWSPRRG